MKAQVGSILIISWSLQKPKLIIVITPPLHLLSQVFIHSCPCHVLPHLSGHKGFQKPLGKGEGSIYGTHWHSLEGMYIYIYKLNMYIYIYIHTYCHYTYVPPGDSSRDLCIPKRWRSPTTFKRGTCSPSQIMVTKTCQVYYIRYCHGWSELLHYPSWN